MTKKNDSNRARLLIVWGVLVAAALGLGCRLYYLQIVRGKELLDKARQQQTVNLRPYIPRRSIVDRQDNVIATDRIVYELYAHPQQFKISRQDIAEQLAKILDNYTPNKLTQIFARQKSGIRLAYALPEGSAERVRRLSLDGLELIEHYYRYYPQQETFADVIGYVKRGEHKGQAGIEYSQQQLLQRSVSTSKVGRYGNGTLMPQYLPSGLLQVDELRLQLTLDIRLQRATRMALKQQMKKFNGKRGAAIVMDVRDGSILALVCEPTYNPNKYGEYNLELFKNWAVSDLYEPGSTFKPINVAIALDAKVIKPDLIVNDTGKIKVDGWNIYNHDYWNTQKGRGEIGIAKILQHSSNVGMIKITDKLGRADYYQHLEDLGLKEKVGVDLPGDAPGYLKDKKLFTSKSIEAATAAFGQGLSLTPLKLVQLHAAIANGGKLVTPHVVRGLIDIEGEIRWQANLKSRKLFSEQTSRTVLEMMETVVTEGSGQKAIIEGYRIAGKTGTAQKASKNGGYKQGAKIVSFVAILPVEEPRYVVLTVVDEPRKAHAYGSTVAAPIAKSIMDALIAIEGLPPANIKKN
ncbi:MAG: penicillin-binding protein 2 [Prochloraceae cyanobacterium]|nr:penicillin-binding protein 2 [Prochloraceae cyanobacterium]